MPEHRRRSTALTILDALDDPHLFGRLFRGETWAAWRAALAAVFALLPMDAAQVATYQRHTGRTMPPTAPAKEAWFVVGRRGGKSRIAALVAVFLAAFKDYAAMLAPGEMGTVALIAADRRQARVLMRYVTGLLDRVPMLAQMVTARTAESLTLADRIVIEIHTSSFRSIRGYTIVAAICDEVAFWRSEDSADPDVEILNAIRPAMATVPDALLLCISSPYRRRGALWEAHRGHFGQDGDRVLVWQADTRAMNPAVDERIVREAYSADESAASAEYGAQFRHDLEDYVSYEALMAVVMPDVRERAPEPLRRYVAFVDPSGGVADSMTLAIAHREDDRAVLDLVGERRAPFDPRDVVQEFASVLKGYDVTKVVGDHYAGEWPKSEFRKRGIRYTLAEQTRSELYLALLPEITMKRVALLDHPRLLRQLAALERRTSRAGRDAIDHAPGAHDDVANAVAGALVLAAGGRRGPTRPTLEVGGTVRITPVDSGVAAPARILIPPWHFPPPLPMVHEKNRQPHRDV